MRRCENKHGALLLLQDCSCDDRNILRSFYTHRTDKGKGGRLGDHQAKGLSADFIDNGIELKRFKTGTPPRLLGKSLNFQGLERQSGDTHPTKFAFYDSRNDSDVFHVEHSGKWLKKNFNFRGSNLVDCFVTETSTGTQYN